jgi:hypothetical protein
MTFVLDRNTYRPPRPVTGIALLFLYVDDVRTSQETPFLSHSSSLPSVALEVNVVQGLACLPVVKHNCAR